MTPLAVRATALGQTVFLSTVGIFILADRTLRASSDPDVGTIRGSVLLIVVLWALTAKPPLAVTAGAAMLALGFYRPVAWAAAMAALGAVLTTPFLGVHWVADYVSMISAYDTMTAAPAFGWSRLPDQMSNLRAFLAMDIGLPDDLASPLSNAVWVLSILLVGWAGARRRAAPARIWTLTILSYLLFCSHVNSTEELLLVLVPPLAVPWNSAARAHERIIFWLGVPLALLFSPAIGPAADLRPAPLWFFEVGLFGWLCLRGTRGLGAAGRQTPAP